MIMALLAKSTTLVHISSNTKGKEHGCWFGIFTPRPIWHNKCCYIVFRWHAECLKIKEKFKASESLLSRLINTYIYPIYYLLMQNPFHLYVFLCQIFIMWSEPSSSGETPNFNVQLLVLKYNQRIHIIYVTRQHTADFPQMP